MTSAAACEFWAFFLVMEVISSADAEVSSSDAACSDAPCASDWLEEATCAAAEAICVAPSLSCDADCRSAALMPRTTQKIITLPASADSASMPQVHHSAMDAAFDEFRAHSCP